MNAPSSTRRYLSLWAKRLATDRIARGLPAPADADDPLIVVAPVKSALRLTAVNEAGARLGLKVGMALADARAMYPHLAAVDADPQSDRRTLEAIADWCDRYTPLVGLDSPDGLVLDVTGCAHLFGGEAALCRDIIARLGRQGFQARAAVADTVGCAWGVARYGTSSSARPRASGDPGQQTEEFEPAALDSRLRGNERNKASIQSNGMRSGNPLPDPRIDLFIVPSGKAREALSSLPLAALRLAPETVVALAQAGLKQVQDVLDRPRAPLAARFAGLVRRIDQALGRDEESIAPRLPLPRYVAEQRFSEPIALERDVLGTIQRLGERLRHTLEQHGEGARLLQVALFRADGKVHRIEVGTAAPVRDSDRLRHLFAERLAAVGEACDPGFGFDMVRLSALTTERLDPMQTGMAAPNHDADLAHFVDRLGARFGLRRVCRLVPRDTHIPEFAVAALPAHALRSFPGRSATRSGALQTRDPALITGVPDQRCTALRCTASGTRAESLSVQDSLAPLRPIKLFERPEPIEAIAEVPDGPPVRFCWRHVWHQVVQAEGPERIAMEWWRHERGSALTRDYFRVESKEGVRVWLYREGRYVPGPRTSQWFLHGLFA